MNTRWLLILSAVFAFLTDQASKYFVVYGLDGPVHHNIPVIPPILNFRYVQNPGINFGLLGADSNLGRWGLTLLALTVIAFVLYWTRDRIQYKRVAISTGLLVGGALGNVYDRIVHGYVVDFINNSLPGWNNPFSYNLADVWVFVGIIGLLVFEPKKQTS